MSSGLDGGGKKRKKKTYTKPKLLRWQIWQSDAVRVYKIQLASMIFMHLFHDKAAWV